MKLRLRQSDYLRADLSKRVDWYRDNAGPEVAERFVAAVESTLRKLAKKPDLGRLRFVQWPELAGIRSFRVEKPFHRNLIFYRADSEFLLAERLIHGARDLPRRLRQTPFEGE